MLESVATPVYNYKSQGKKWTGRTEIDSREGHDGQKLFTPSSSGKSTEIIASVNIVNDQHNQCLVGLNLFDEVSNKYYE